MDVSKEIDEIGKILESAVILQEIRREVAAAMKDGFIVTDGQHYSMGSGYDFVVKCGSKDRPDVVRRIRGNIPTVDVKKIADGVIGIRASRRMRKTGA
jgi:hypothetical protein